MLYISTASSFESCLGGNNMTKQKKDLPLLVFTSKKDDYKAVYMVFGKFKKKKMDKKLDLYYPEFYDVTVFTGNLSSVSNVNRMVSCDKTIQISNAYEARRACAGYTQDNQDYHFIRIDNDLKELLDTISKKCINIYGFPLNVLTPNMNMVELLLVTNKYAIYSSDNEYMVMDAHSHQVLKNCVIKCFSVDKAVKGVKTGEEKVFWVCPGYEFILEFPKGQKLLMAYHYTDVNGKEIYKAFYGLLTKQSGKSTGKDIFWQNPKFDESSLIRIKNGYVIEGGTYNITCIERAFSEYTIKKSGFRFEYICDDLKKAGLKFTPFGDGSAFILGEYHGGTQEESFCYGMDIPVKDDAKWRFWKMYDDETVSWNLADEEKEYIKDKTIAYCLNNGYLYLTDKQYFILPF